MLIKLQAQPQGGMYKPDFLWVCEDFQLQKYVFYQFIFNKCLPNTYNVHIRMKVFTVSW